LTTDAQPRIPSRYLLAAAVPYLKHYAARHFGGLRIAVDGPAPEIDGPTVFYSNHPSWWDPIVLILLIRSHYPDWRFHGPIDAAALERYPWLERIGLFGIEPGTERGARRFLRLGSQILDQNRGGLALTAQGRFCDVRSRPLALKRGLGLLLKRKPDARAIPLAIEYVFWNERLPEILVRFGSTPVAARGRALGTIQTDLERALEHELDLLSRAAMARDASRFESLLEGRRGAGLLQDLPFRFRCWLRGERFDPAHAALARNSLRSR
jgi:hypothetical protein